MNSDLPTSIKKEYKLFSLRQIITILIGMFIIVSTLLYGYESGLSSFFNLTLDISDNVYNSVATLFLLGLLVFVFGLFDILRSIYFIWTFKRNRKQ